MDNTPRSEFHNDENIYHIKEDRILCKKITGKDLAFMIFYKCSPSLTSLWIARISHIPSQRARGILNTEFDFQLFEYFVFTLSGIFSAYSLDKLDMFSWNTRPTDLVGSRTPTPVRLEFLTMPTDDGIRLHQNKRRLPTFPKLGQ